MAIRADNIGSKISIDDIRDFIPDDHPCFLVEKIVERVDFSEWEELHWDTPGNPAYHPRVSLRAIIQGYIDGVRSGRELGRRVKTDLPYIYLCGVDGPDFRTLNRFYKEFAHVIVLTLVEVSKFAKDIGMLKIGSLALDSTTVKANASSFNVASEKQIRAILETVYEIILTNEEDDELLGDDSGYNVPIDLEDDEEFEKYYKEVIDYAKNKLDDEKLKFPARKQLKNAIKNPEKVVENLEMSLENLKKSGQNTVNLTDNESLWHFNKKKYTECGYLVHNVVEMDSGLTLYSMATSYPKDDIMFVPVFDEYESLYGDIGSEIPLVADNGYWKDEILEQIQDRGWDAYIPNKQLATLYKKDLDEIWEFSKYNFPFSEDFSYCTCPNGHKLPKHNTKKYENGQTKTFYYTQSKICKNCPDHDECCKSSNVRIITHFGGNLSKEMFLKMESEKGKEIYKPRFSKAESPFALGKEYLNMRQARARGVMQMDLQAKLTTIASNIIKINNYMWENEINT